MLATMPTVIFATGLNVKRQLKYCHKQVMASLGQLDTNDFYMQPRNILATDKGKCWNCRPSIAEEWCTGFWSGILWMDYMSTKDPEVRRCAEGYTKAIEPIVRQSAYDHDLGFIVINSFMKGYEATGKKEYKDIALRAADTLATLFNPAVGTILSWPRHVKDYKGHNTIMDNMINLELLYWAAENGGGKQLADIATKHAETTMRHHFRPDGSCFHVAVYDTLTGKHLYNQTHQGYADYSMWSRGQSWAIYGYTMVYRFTKDRKFLKFAEKVTGIYLKRLKETSDDWVPLWDMDAKPTAVDRNVGNDGAYNGIPKDASAAAVVASALTELAGYVDSAKGKEYMDAAKSMIADLSSKRYQSRNKNSAFLMHSTGHHPAGSEIDASIIYADYYYLEALLHIRDTIENGSEKQSFMSLYQ